VAKSASGELTVDNENIPGFMPAMIMPYPVKDAQGLEQVQPGDVITANVVVQNSDNYWLEHLAITDKSGRTAVLTNAVHELLPGEKVPDVALVNQDGKTATIRMRTLASQRTHDRRVVIVAQEGARRFDCRAGTNRCGY